MTEAHIEQRKSFAAWYRKGAGGLENWMFSDEKLFYAEVAENVNNLNSLFLPKERWPANSLDLNPLDYYYWNAVVTRMSSTEIPADESELIECVSNE